MSHKKKVRSLAQTCLPMHVGPHLITKSHDGLLIRGSLCGIRVAHVAEPLTWDGWLMVCGAVCGVGTRG